MNLKRGLKQLWWEPERNYFGVWEMAMQDRLKKVIEGTFWNKKNVLYLDWWDGNMSIFIYQTHQNVCLKWIWFCVCKLDLIKMKLCYRILGPENIGISLIAWSCLKFIPGRNKLTWVKKCWCLNAEFLFIIVMVAEGKHTQRNGRDMRWICSPRA